MSRAGGSGASARPVLGVLAAALLLSVLLRAVKLAEYRDWQPTQGTLIAVQQVDSLGKHLDSGGYVLHYTYAVEGRSCRGSQSFSGSRTRKAAVGEMLEIWYDPAEPSRSMCHRPGPGLWPLVPFVFAVPLSLLAWEGSRRSGPP